MRVERASVARLNYGLERASVARLNYGLEWASVAALDYGLERKSTRRVRVIGLFGMCVDMGSMRIWYGYAVMWNTGNSLNAVACWCYKTCM